jgi:hypothetical protein
VNEDKKLKIVSHLKELKNEAIEIIEQWMIKGKSHGAE